ncbi:hypothetical protein KGQ64_18275 [bacterium]|nr:hypothetical protein [bacterium]
MSAVEPPRRPWYRNLPLVAGLGLIALGLGNWATGSARLADLRTDTATEPTSTRTRGRDAAVEADVEIARVRQDFYHVVATGGRLLVATGIVLAAFGAVRGRRAEAPGRH